MTMRQAVGRMVKLYAGREYRLRGESFATLPELKMICEDPLAFVNMLNGEDATSILRLALHF